VVYNWNGEDYIFRSRGVGGLAWSQQSGEIAFALENRRTKQSELWITTEAGTNPRMIYAAKEGSIVISEFLD